MAKSTPSFEKMIAARGGTGTTAGAKAPAKTKQVDPPKPPKNC
jgi:hypothetical protein